MADAEATVGLPNLAGGAGETSGIATSRIERTSSARTRMALLAVMAVLVIPISAFAQEAGMLIRIAEIQIDPADVKQYAAILAEEAADSVRLEPGVIAIFPMYQKDDPTQIEILEIYASRKAYESHLETPHFKRYKTATAKMVKSLKLVDMEPLDATTMAKVFEKMASTR